jgi:hypothetical protein
MSGVHVTSSLPPSRRVSTSSVAALHRDGLNVGRTTAITHTDLSDYRNVVSIERKQEIQQMNRGTEGQVTCYYNNDEWRDESYCLEVRGSTRRMEFSVARKYTSRERHESTTSQSTVLEVNEVKGHVQ